MEEIRLISTSVVQSSSHHCERIELTPWDLQVLLVGLIQNGLLFLKPIPSQQQQLLANTIVDHLKISFSRKLNLFPILAGRLYIIKKDDSTSSFFVDCNNVGAHFIHAVTEKHISVDKKSPHEFKSSSLISPAETLETVARLFQAPFRTLERSPVVRTSIILNLISQVQCEINKHQRVQIQQIF
mgnify:CR=1 FL=1